VVVVAGFAALRMLRVATPPTQIIVARYTRSPTSPLASAAALEPEKTMGSTVPLQSWTAGGRVEVVVAGTDSMKISCCLRRQSVERSEYMTLVVPTMGAPSAYLQK